jgi:hypothetical protein
MRISPRLVASNLQQSRLHLVEEVVSVVQTVLLLQEEDEALLVPLHLNRAAEGSAKLQRKSHSRILRHLRHLHSSALQSETKIAGLL